MGSPQEKDTATADDYAGVKALQIAMKAEGDVRALGIEFNGHQKYLDEVLNGFKDSLRRLEDGQQRIEQKNDAQHAENKKTVEDRIELVHGRISATKKLIEDEAGNRQKTVADAYKMVIRLLWAGMFLIGSALVGLGAYTWEHRNDIPPAQSTGD